MRTEIILYRANAVVNGRFAYSLANYGWEYTGAWVKHDGFITMTPGSSSTLYQSDVAMYGQVYRLRFRVDGQTNGLLRVRSRTGGTIHLTVSASGSQDVTFTSDGTDLLFDCNAGFDGDIYNVELYTVPHVYNLDLFEDEPIPFNFNIDSIFKLGERKTAWSKTTELPGTHNNNQAFGHIYKVNSEGVFDPRYKARSVIKSSGMVVFDGYMSLDKISKFVGGEVRYSVTFVGEVASVYDKLEGKTIKDLDFSAYNHPLNLITMRYSWGQVHGGAYSGTSSIPRICRNSTTPNFNTHTITYTAPAISAIGSHTVDGVARVQITFTSAHQFSVGNEVWIAADNNLISGVHTIVEVPSNTRIALAMAFANLTSTTSAAGSSVTKRSINAVGYFYPLVDYGSYALEQSSGVLTNGLLYTAVDVNMGDDFTNVAKDPLNPTVPIAVTNGVTFLCSDGINSYPVTVAPISWTGGTILNIHTLASDDGVLYDKNLTINRWHLTDLIPHIFIREIWTKMEELTGYDIDCEVVDTDLFKRLVMPCDQKFNVEDYANVVMNDWLPGMRLSDFFNAILNMFNLVILEDKDDKSHITLVSRNDFYDSGSDVTWDVDSAQPFEIKLANTMLPKYYHLKYKDASDFYNLDYNKEIGDITNTEGVANDIDRKYGDYYLSTGNQFSQAANKVEIGFVPTVMAGPTASVYAGSDKTISVAYHADIDGTNLSRQTAFRILIAGFRGTDDAWSITTSISDVNEVMDVVWPNFNRRIFPYAMHIDNAFDGIPYHDINFDNLLGTYLPYTWDATLWAENTLVGRHWSRHLLSITDRSCKHVTGTVRLKVTDVAKLDFRNIVRPRNLGLALKLQKLIDWDLNGSGLCRGEFITK